MKTTRKIVIARTVLLAVLVLSAGAFATAVYQDRSSGSLMDAEGVIDKDFL